MQWTVNVAEVTLNEDGFEQARGVVARFGGELVWEGFRAQSEPWRIIIPGHQGPPDEDLYTLVIGEEIAALQHAVIARISWFQSR